MSQALLDTVSADLVAALDRTLRRQKQFEPKNESLSGDNVVLLFEEIQGKKLKPKPVRFHPQRNGKYHHTHHKR